MQSFRDGGSDESSRRRKSFSVWNKSVSLRELSNRHLMSSGGQAATIRSSLKA